MRKRKPPATCIYCKATSADVPFNREHVLHEGFGRFRNALVLHDAVCQPCNQYFSETLDRALTRESVEGLERYRWGVKKPQEIERFNYRSVSLIADQGDFSGARFQLKSGAGPKGLAAQLLPSAAFHNAEGDGFSSFTIEEILSGTWQQSKVDRRRGVKLFGDDASVERMKAALAVQGVTFSNYRPLASPSDGPAEVEVSQEFRITDEMRRGVAKIAFNYFAYRQTPEQALTASFDVLRQYIRYAERPSIPPVVSNWKLPFRTDRTDQMRPVVHFIGLASHVSHRNLLGTVSLFGFMQHKVLLAQAYPGPWMELPVAHVFNVKTLVAQEMQTTKPRWRHAQLPEDVNEPPKPSH